MFDTSGYYESLTSIYHFYIAGIIVCTSICLLVLFGFGWSATNAPPKYPRGSYQRRQLDRLRAKSGQFPPPYPNGWYRVCQSKDLAKGSVVSVSLCGREVVAFRGDNGEVGVLHAFCPHLGTHLGGGTVHKNNLVCPYHSWEFDSSGKNKCIPYCKKDMSRSKRVDAKRYHTRERLGMVFMWYHSQDTVPFMEPRQAAPSRSASAPIPEAAADPQPAEDAGTNTGEPEFELDILKEIEDGDYRFVAAVPFEDWHMHIMEPSQNSADWYHFKTVHQWLGQDSRDLLKFLHMDHMIKAMFGTKGDSDTNYGPLPKQCLFIDEELLHIKLFNVLPFPSFICRALHTQVRIMGPQTIIFRISIPVFGEFRGVFTLTSEEPFYQRAMMMAWVGPWFPWVFARMLMHMVMQTVNQDRHVWEHKLAVNPRNLVAGDGPFAPYGKWLGQFYTQESVEYKEQSLEW